jgi:hypothetical protein
MRKPISDDSTITIESNSLIRHLISDNTDELDDEDDDDSFDASVFFSWICIVIII